MSHRRMVPKLSQIFLEFPDAIERKVKSDHLAQLHQHTVVVQKSTVDARTALLQDGLNLPPDELQMMPTVAVRLKENEKDPVHLRLFVAHPLVSPSLVRVAELARDGMFSQNNSVSLRNASKGNLAAPIAACKMSPINSTMPDLNG